MATAVIPEPSLAELLAQLKEAVRTDDRDRATKLQRLILQRLSFESSELANIERTVRSLMEDLEQRALEAATTPPLTLDRELGVESAKGTVFPVWFGTNRKPVLKGQGFTGDRNHGITYGRADVYIPKSHRPGETGSSLFRRLLRLDLRDDHLRLQKITGQTPEDFYAEVQAVMQEARNAGDGPHALVYLHGFNVGFNAAAIRAAQLGKDLGVPGATAFFSWPSRDSVFHYTADEATIDASESAITTFLVDFAAKSGADKMHVIAHSMGNRGLLRALQRIAANAEIRDTMRFGQIFLAAPDVDQDLFLDLAWLCGRHAERTTLYSSHRDQAVHASYWKHAAPRAGYFLPYTLVDGVDTISVPDFDVDLLGHSYYAQARALLDDIRERILPSGKSSEQRNLSALTYDGKRLWSLQAAE